MYTPKLQAGDSFIFTKEMNESKKKTNCCYSDASDLIGLTIQISKITETKCGIERYNSDDDHGVCFHSDIIDQHLPSTERSSSTQQWNVGDKYPDWANLPRAKRADGPTYQEQTLFVMVEAHHDWCSIGEIIKLKYNDMTGAPLFLLRDGETRYIHYDRLALLPQAKAGYTTHSVASQKYTKQTNITKENFIYSLKHTKSDLTQKFKALLRTDLEKAYIKAGVMDEGATLTREGELLFVNYLLKKYGKEFKEEVVDMLLADQIDQK